MTDREKQKRRIGLFLILLCPILVFIVLPRSPNMGPDHQGRALVDASEWQPLTLAGQLPYQWLSQNTLLVKKEEGPWLVDIARHTAVEATDVRQALRQHPEYGFIATAGIREWCASPDGKWLMTAAPNHSFDHQGSIFFGTLVGKWVAVKLDGSRVLDFPAELRENTELFWSPDSTQVMVFDSGGLGCRLIKFPIAKPGAPITITLPRYMAFRVPGVALGMVGTNRLLIGAWGRSLHLTTVGLADPVHDVFSERIDPPGNAVISEVELSPNGKRLAWVLNFPRTSASGLREIVPFLHAQPGHTVGEVWVSDRNGSHLHPVVTGDSGGDPLQSPHAVRWTPDGNDVSFIYHGTLYEASAL